VVRVGPAHPSPAGLGNADGLEEAVVAGNLGKRRKSGAGHASESESSPVKKARRTTRNLDPDSSDSKSGSGSDKAETSDSDEAEATGATVIRSKEKLKKQSNMQVNSYNIEIITMPA
jgi:hypothetical protein